VILAAKQICKSFLIPSVRRDTVREHLFGLFRPRRLEPLRVLDGVSFTIAPGETVGIMGRNGSGKSTLLRILAGIYEPSSGVVEARAPITPLLGLGVGWNEELNAIDNTYLLGCVLGMSLTQIDERLPKILAFAGLERFAKLELKHFSSGMAARLAYSVAFSSVHEIVLLDEIFAVGDFMFRERCEARCRELVAAGHTVVLVSHDPDIVSRFCQRALLIERGRVLVDDRASVVAKAYLDLMGQGPPEAREADGGAASGGAGT
jgi:ABC-type polysaccharide/polyol phosphate transport system ATPase subunit